MHVSYYMYFVLVPRAPGASLLQLRPDLVALSSLGLLVHLVNLALERLGGNISTHQPCIRASRTRAHRLILNVGVIVSSGNGATLSRTPLINSNLQSAAVPSSVHYAPVELVLSANRSELLDDRPPNSRVLHGRLERGQVGRANPAAQDGRDEAGGLSRIHHSQGNEGRASRVAVHQQRRE